MSNSNIMRNFYVYQILYNYPVMYVYYIHKYGVYESPINMY